MNSVVNGICPELNATNKKLLWLDLDKRSKYCYWFCVDYNMNGTARAKFLGLTLLLVVREGTELLLPFIRVMICC
jgi:hypothetical protein